jgi:hypothetical protein
MRVVWSDGQGQNCLFACHSSAMDCGEDGRGDLPFVAGYGARRPVMAKRSLDHGERSRSALAATHSRVLFFPFLLLPFLNPSRRQPSPRRACVQAYPERPWPCRDASPDHGCDAQILARCREWRGGSDGEADEGTAGCNDHGLLITSPRGCGLLLGRSRGQEVQTLQSKWRRPQHSGDLLCPDTNRGVLFPTPIVDCCSSESMSMVVASPLTNESERGLQGGGSPISTHLLSYISIWPHRCRSCNVT